MPNSETEPIERFIRSWGPSSASESGNFQPFALELCDIIEVERPKPRTADPAFDSYGFEYPVKLHDLSTGQRRGEIDLYKRNCFVMEAKQGAVEEASQLPLWGGDGGKRRLGIGYRDTKRWSLAMQGARGQAERYAKSLPPDHGWRPFLIIVDVGFCIELYADFTRTGKAYAQFPDAQGFRIRIDDLIQPDVRQLLRTVWTDPMSLDPAARAEQVTKRVSQKLAFIAKELEQAGYAPESVANFLMRCMFSMFAEDIGLLPRGSFSTLLQDLRDRNATPTQTAAALQTLWLDMDKGNEWSPSVRDGILQFNGGLFEGAHALPIEAHHRSLLIDAATAVWRDVEPAIFGTFLEQALDPAERRKLGAEFTPRRWVERLVMPTVVEPLRKRWSDVKTEALGLDLAGDRQEAVSAVKRFHRELCELRILDPACGSGNFLYVTMEHLKRLEGEVLDLLTTELGENQDALELERFTVDPHQFLGIEKNERAAWVADVVLWIGYLQWHFKTRGRVTPAQPVLRNFHNIECRDALLDWDRVELVTDEEGKPVTRWDGHTMTTNLLTDREVPDETARVEIERYVNPRAAAWPEADYIIGNPPFTGGKDLRERLGGYAEALWAAYKDMPKSADLVMYWWKRAADLVRTARVRRFGLISTNSLPQTFNRRVVAQALEAKPPLSLAFAIPDHPWYVDGGMASVRVAMTVGVPGRSPGELHRVVDPKLRALEGGDQLRPKRTGSLWSNLTIGAKLDDAEPLRANEALSSPGVKLHGSGFIVSREKARALGLGRVPGLERHIREYRNGRDLTRRPRDVMVIDLFGLSEDEVRRHYPQVFQHLLDTVKPERDAKIGRSKDMSEYAKNWWLFGKPRGELRPALHDLQRFIATVETAKHRVFQFLDASILPDNKIIGIAIDDGYILGVMSSKIHVKWALSNGSRLGIGNDPVYVKSRCFDTFPFPWATDAQQDKIRRLAEELDVIRKRVLAQREDLTLTGLYNVREALIIGRALSTQELAIHEMGCVGVIKELHDAIDAAVADAYGWPADLPEDAILERVVALNLERQAEERRGLVRWLRPDYQTPGDVRVEVFEQREMAIDIGPKTATAKKPRWPAETIDRIAAIADLLDRQTAPQTAAELASAFQRRPVADVDRVLHALAMLGRARHVGEGRFTP